MKSASLAASRRARIEERLARGDIEGAAEQAEAALAAGQEEPMLLNLAAWLREEKGDYGEAHRLLQRALALAPGDPFVLGSIGAVLRKERRYEEAMSVLDRVVAAEPGHAAAWLERGYTLEAIRQERAAAESYRTALAIDPGLAPALGKLADLAARRGSVDEGRDYALRAIEIDPLQPAANFGLAVMETESGKGAEAEARLRRLLTANLKEEDRTRSLTLLGDALDRQNRAAEAFDVYRQAQDNFRTSVGDILAPGPERPSHRSFIEAITAQVEAAAPMAGPAARTDVPGAADKHIFLLGYPRSGTTLVENILASAPDVIALEERDTFAGIDEALLANDGAMPDLDALDPRQVEDLRADYWRRVEAMAGSVSGHTFVDMNPFNGIKLPIIARLFPEARILIMRRDPRDVVLSCFKINFTASPAAFAFSDLEETARHYDALMSLTELCRNRLPLAFHEIRYDRLVADFEPTVRALAEFVGLEWTEAFRTFDKTALARGVRTASATQVRRGLYDGGGRWKRYRTELEPVLPILQPWVEKLGFEP